MSIDTRQLHDNAVRYRRLARITTDARLARQLRERADDYDRQRSGQTTTSVR